MYFALVRVAVHQLVKFKFSNLIIAYPKSTVKQKHRLPSTAVIARPQAVAISWYCGQNLHLVPGDRRVASLLAMTAVDIGWFFCFDWAVIRLTVPFFKQRA